MTPGIWLTVGIAVAIAAGWRMPPWFRTFRIAVPLALLYAILLLNLIT